MNNTHLAAAMAIAAMVGMASADTVLFDAATARPSSVHAQDGAAFSLENGLLTVTTKPSDKYPGICVSGRWDLSKCRRVEVEFVRRAARPLLAA